MDLSIFDRDDFRLSAARSPKYFGERAADFGLKSKSKI
jgi:hypothetical protein